MAHPLITARWQHVAVVTYAVPAGALLAYVPVGPDGVKLELDVRGAAGPVVGGSGGVSGARAFVSLVATEVVHARVFGVKWPWLSRYTELLLRVHVKHGTRRGVCVVRGVVSSPVFAWGARKAFNGAYVAAPVMGEVKQQHRSIGVEYRLHWPEGGLAPGDSAVGQGAKGRVFQEHLVRLLAAKPVARPGPESLEQWFLQQQWVFGMDRTGKGIVNEVIHPLWGVYPVVETHVRVDFASIFGTDFGFLGDAKPFSSLLATGSEVAMFQTQGDVGVRWGEKR